MAVRRPLYWTGDGLRPMSDAMIDDIVDRAVALYNNNPSVTLDVVSDNGNLRTMNDTRFEAGDATRRSGRYSTEAETPDIEEVVIYNDRIDQTVASGTSYPTNTDNIAFPTYQTGSDVRTMTRGDFVDTFIKPAIDKLLTSTVAGYTVISDAATAPNTVEAVDNTPIFINTIADVSKFTAVGIPETKDQPETVDSYKLYRYKNTTPAALSQKPLKLTSRTDPHIQQMSDTELNDLLEDTIRHTAANDTTAAHRIRYNINVVGGTNRGSPMLDTRLNGTSAAGYTQKPLGIYDNYYETQEFPNGIETTINTYNLTITKS